MGASKKAGTVKYFPCITKSSITKLSIQFKPLILYADKGKTKIWKLLLVAFLAVDERFYAEKYAIESKQESQEVIKNAKFALLVNTADVTGRRFDGTFTWLKNKAFRNTKNPELWAFAVTAAFFASIFSLFVTGVGIYVYFTFIRKPDIINNTDIDPKIIKELCEQYPELPECNSLPSDSPPTTNN